MKHDFGEKEKEWSAKENTEVPVWQSDKYKAAKAKAIEVIESNKYGLLDSDFWILMNATKSKKMAYTGLIISHNGCLKINDCMEEKLKFKPECVTFEPHGFNDSLVFHYCCPEQGLYEVGEVSSKNCKNDYPYAMALKRCFDRVVLKLCKLAYAGVYSDSEADEFKEQIEAPAPQGEAVPQTPPTTETNWRSETLKLWKAKGFEASELSEYFEVSKETTNDQWREIYGKIMDNNFHLRS